MLEFIKQYLSGEKWEEPLQNQQNLKADGIYSCTGIYFFKLAMALPLARY